MFVDKACLGWRSWGWFCVGAQLGGCFCGNEVFVNRVMPALLALKTCTVRCVAGRSLQARRVAPSFDVSRLRGYIKCNYV